MTSVVSAGRGIGRLILLVAGGATVGVTVGWVVNRVSGDRMAPWILGRASGACAYLMLFGLVLFGLSLSHPLRAQRGRFATTRMRAHVVLALLTFGFIVLHVVALATDAYAGVGWWGAAMPWGAQYRPLPVTLGVLGVWLGLLAGGSAALAGRLPRRIWWPVHKVAALTFVLVWLHGVFAGSDTKVLLGMYVGTGLLVLGAVVDRYVRRRPGVLDEVPA
jgi:cytochrome b561